MTDDSLFLIDVDKILRTKAPKQYKYIPKFVTSYLKRIVHQDEINIFLDESKDKVGVDFLEACMDFLDAKVDVKGIENLPKDGLYTFVSNHPLGGQDGVALGYVLGRHYDGKVKYLVNDLLMNLRGLAPLCIPINKTGKQAKDFPKMVEAAAVCSSSARPPRLLLILSMTPLRLFMFPSLSVMLIPYFSIAAAILLVGAAIFAIAVFKEVPAMLPFTLALAMRPRAKDVSSTV